MTEATLSGNELYTKLKHVEPLSMLPITGEDVADNTYLLCNYSGYSANIVVLGNDNYLYRDNQND